MKVITKNHIRKSFKTCFTASLLLAWSIYAFASMGDDRKKDKKSGSLLKAPTFAQFHPGLNPFSLKSTYNYRGSEIVSTQQRTESFVLYNSVVTYKNGNTIHILPSQQKVLLKKFKTPTPPPPGSNF